MATKAAHGGRRRGLNPAGEASILRLRVSDADRTRVERLAEVWRVTVSEAVRRAVSEAVASVEPE